MSGVYAMPQLLPRPDNPHQTCGKSPPVTWSKICRWASKTISKVLLDQAIPQFLAIENPHTLLQA